MPRTEPKLDVLHLLVEQLGDAVAERVAMKLRPMLEELVKSAGRPAGPTLFTTNKAGPHLPGKTRRWMLDHIRAMPGARKVGRDWEISPSDYDAWLTSEDDRRIRAFARRHPPAPKPLESLMSEDDLVRVANELLDEQGFRRTK